MIAEYLEEYQEGVPLTEVQRLLNEQETAVNQILYKVSGHINIDTVSQRADELRQSHVSVSSCYRKVAGYTAQRALPSLEAKVHVHRCEWDLQAAPTLAQLSVKAPLEVAPEQGVNLDICLVAYADEQFIAVRAFALALDIASLQLIADYVTGEGDIEDVLQFPDFVAWQLDMFDDEEGLAGQAYWQNYVSSALPSPLQLPYKKGAIEASNYVFAHCDKRIPENVLAGIEALSNELGLTSETLIQFSWWWLLARLTPEQSFLTQLNYDPRSESEEFEGALGCYEKGLPLAIDYQGQLTFKAWVQQLQEVVESHYQWGECVSSDQLSLVANHTGTVYKLDTSAMDWISGQQSELQLLMLGNTSLRVCYASHCYSGAAIESLLTQLLQLLTTTAHTRGDINNASISLLNDVERRSLLAMNVASEPAPATVIEQIAQFSVSQPSALAINDGKQTITYAQLQTQITQFSAGLCAVSQGSTQPVALLLPRSAEMAVAMLGAMALGVGYIPLDPEWPNSRIEQVLGQFSNITVIDLDGERGTPFAEVIDAGLTAPVVKAPLGELAYVIFTSGSTGTPKGVQVQQSQLSQYCYASTRAMALQAQSHFALTAAVTADLGYTCLFNALYLGKSLHIASELQSKEREAFEAFLSDNQIDCIKIVPSHLQALCDASALSYLPKKIILGGEACPVTFLRSLQQWSPNSEIYNHYGPSEATVGVMSHAYTKDHGAVAKLSTVFTGTEVFILNDQRQLCATGEVGQLYIAGAQLAVGYLNSDNTPFVTGTEWAERIYATGDLARYMPDNTVMILGRQDDQVKIRGVRIEPQEVAKSIESTLDVEHCVVVSDKLNNEHVLVAYVSATEAVAGQLSNEEVAKLQRRLRDNLPDVMIPNCFMYVNEWPRLGNGKIDKKSLPEYQHGLSNTFIAPEGELEQQLASMFQEVLGVERVSAEQSFFSLGGHSITAIKLVKRWADKQDESLHFELATLFQAPSVAQLARAIAHQSNSLIQPIKHSTQATRQLICIHDGLGLSLAYRALAEQLPESVNVYGLTPRDTDLDNQANFDSLAQYYAQEIATAFDQQPVEILGWSMGGVLAAKVAEQLVALNRQVDKLVIADSWLPNSDQAIVQPNVAEFLADLVDGENTAWSAAVNTYLEAHVGPSSSDDAIQNHIVHCWDQYANQLPEPFNAIRGEQVAQTYVISTQLLMLRAQGCQVPSLPSQISNIQVIWGEQRSQQACCDFVSSLSGTDNLIDVVQTSLSHEEVVRSQELVKLLG